MDKINTIKKINKKDSINEINLIDYITELLICYNQETNFNTKKKSFISLDHYTNKINILRDNAIKYILNTKINFTISFIIYTKKDIIKNNEYLNTFKEYIRFKNSVRDYDILHIYFNTLNIGENWIHVLNLKYKKKPHFEIHIIDDFTIDKYINTNPIIYNVKNKYYLAKNKTNLNLTLIKYCRKLNIITCRMRKYDTEDIDDINKILFEVTCDRIFTNDKNTLNQIFNMSNITKLYLQDIEYDFKLSEFNNLINLKKLQIVQVKSFKNDKNLNKKIKFFSIHYADVDEDIYLINSKYIFVMNTTKLFFPVIEINNVD